MKICVYGAGAIGGFLGGQLALAGYDVTLIARGAHLAAMKADGLRLLVGAEERVAHAFCTDDPAPPRRITSSSRSRRIRPTSRRTVSRRCWAPIPQWSRR